MSATREIISKARKGERVSGAKYLRREWDAQHARWNYVYPEVHAARPPRTKKKEPPKVEPDRHGYISTADTAKLIRHELGETFWDIRFSVRKTHGNAIDVKWMDGPAEETVRSLTSHYRGSDWDSMQDLSVPRRSTYNGRSVRFSADHVFTKRDYSPAFLTAVAARVAAQFGVDPPTIKTHEDGSAYIASDEKNIQIGGHGPLLSERVMREAHQTNASDILGKPRREARPTPPPEPAAPKEPAAPVDPSAVPSYEVKHDRDWTWLAFDAEPNSAIGEALKTLGFRHSTKRSGKWGKHAWYSKQHVDDQHIHDALSGATAPAPPTPAGVPDTGTDRPQEPTQQASASPAGKLRSMADTMQKQIDAKRNPAIGEQRATARRARIAEGMGRDADRLQRFQGMLSNLADAHDNNPDALPRPLQKLNNKAGLEYLFNEALRQEYDEEQLDRYGSEKYKTTGPSMPPPGFQDTARKALLRAGVNNQNIVYAVHALRELMGKQAEATPEQQVKAKERELIGMKIAGYFPTPDPLARRLVSEADIEPGMSVLEPSAGKGSIADVIRQEHPETALDVVEFNSRLGEILQLKGHNLVEIDALQHKGKYDRIVMNPPFEKGADIDHVKHAFSNLKSGGRVVAIMSEGPFFRNDRKSEDFRAWLDEMGGYSEQLPAGSFQSSDSPTGVNTRMVIIDKPGKSESAPAQHPGSAVHTHSAGAPHGQQPAPHGTEKPLLRRFHQKVHKTLDILKDRDLPEAIWQTMGVSSSTYEREGYTAGIEALSLLFAGRSALTSTDEAISEISDKLEEIDAQIKEGGLANYALRHIQGQRMAFTNAHRAFATGNLDRIGVPDDPPTAQQHPGPAGDARHPADDVHEAATGASSQTTRKPQPKLHVRMGKVPTAPQLSKRIDEALRHFYVNRHERDLSALGLPNHPDVRDGYSRALNKVQSALAANEDGKRPSAKEVHAFLEKEIAATDKALAKETGEHVRPYLTGFKLGFEKVLETLQTGDLDALYNPVEAPTPIPEPPAPRKPERPVFGTGAPEPSRRRTKKPAPEPEADQLMMFSRARRLLHRSRARQHEEGDMHSNSRTRELLNKARGTGARKPGSRYISREWDHTNQRWKYEYNTKKPPQQRGAHTQDDMHQQRMESHPAQQPPGREAYQDPHEPKVIHSTEHKEYGEAPNGDIMSRTKGGVWRFESTKAAWKHSPDNPESPRYEKPKEQTAPEQQPAPKRHTKPVESRTQRTLSPQEQQIEADAIAAFVNQAASATPEQRQQVIARMQHYATAESEWGERLVYQGHKMSVAGVQEAIRQIEAIDAKRELAGQQPPQSDAPYTRVQTAGPEGDAPKGAPIPPRQPDHGTQRAMIDSSEMESDHLQQEQAKIDALSTPEQAIKHLNKIDADIRRAQKKRNDPSAAYTLSNLEQLKLHAEKKLRQLRGERAAAGREKAAASREKAQQDIAGLEDLPPDTPKREVRAAVEREHDETKAAIEQARADGLLNDREYDRATTLLFRDVSPHKHHKSSVANMRNAVSVARDIRKQIEDRRAEQQQQEAPALPSLGKHPIRYQPARDPANIRIEMQLGNTEVTFAPEDHGSIHVAFSGGRMSKQLLDNIAAEFGGTVDYKNKRRLGDNTMLYINFEDKAPHLGMLARHLQQAQESQQKKVNPAAASAERKQVMEQVDQRRQAAVHKLTEAAAAELITEEERQEHLSRFKRVIPMRQADHLVRDMGTEIRQWQQARVQVAQIDQDIDRVLAEKRSQQKPKATRPEFGQPVPRKGAGKRKPTEPQSPGNAEQQMMFSRRRSRTAELLRKARGDHPIGSRGHWHEHMDDYRAAKKRGDHEGSRKDYLDHVTGGWDQEQESESERRKDLKELRHLEAEARTLREGPQLRKVQHKIARLQKRLKITPAA